MIINGRTWICPMTWVKSFLGFSILSLCIYGTMLVPNVLFQKFGPLSYYFNYVAVEPASSINPADSEITFISYFEVFDYVDLYYSDTLYCDLSDGHGFVYYSNYTSQNISRSPSDSLAGKEWKYHGAVPKTDAMCFLRATITVGLSHARRTQILNSDYFYIKS